MRLILEEEQPVLRLTVDCDSDLHGARVYLFRFVKLVELSVSLEVPGRDRPDVHQVDRLGAAELFPGVEVFLICLLYVFIVELYRVYGSVECRMAAVVRPVSVDHADLCYRRVTLLVPEVVAHEP